MKGSKLIQLIQFEIDAFGDPEITVYCPEHSGQIGESGDPQPIHGLGWFCGMNGEKSTFIGCAECHVEAMNEKAWSDAMDEAEAGYGDGAGDDLEI